MLHSDTKVMQLYRVHVFRLQSYLLGILMNMKQHPLGVPHVKSR